ncbi:tyrosine-type recombinase/integrase [Streptomyces sp. HUCO-GS316]|uniref:tyrosine-type recombinase/integrase n=1 Tax=Streptomyces sp. HUCO-GS316 TaxID=2692198 RepID=UPI0013682E86|nr:site-specific integrase [Streptomyces sp. HUCO-GS316]MXM66733.1 tyrosine-type recombinase/integrase [Streptomyces sp. HUCO-GS316]
MASVHPRRNRRGEVTAWLVKWRLGGTREGAQQTERFEPTEDGRESAEVFKEAVNEAGQQWPPGWVKGQGLINPEAEEVDRCRFQVYATASVVHRTGVEDRYRDACLGELTRYVFPTFGNCDVRSTQHFSRRTIQAWVNQLAATEVRRGSKRKLMSPKTIKNLHGLLSSILQEAVDEDPPLRDRNPCKGVRLPRTDDHGTSGDDLDEDIEFLEPAEVAGIAARMRTPQGRRLVEDIYATGMRWGEVSALAGRHLVMSDPAKPRVRVTRAWKWSKSKGHYLGTPKSTRSRRTLRITDRTLANWEAQGVLTGGADQLVYRGEGGERLPYSTFYDEWMDGVRRAKAAGVLPEHKNPTIHDLRHSHAAALISAGHSLTYVQRRLGHESIKTTSDLYGHLLPEADEAAMATIDASLDGAPVLPGGPAPVAAAVVPAPRPGGDRSTVHVVLFTGGHQEAFWRPDIARLCAEVWKLERRAEARVEERSASLWEARHGTLDGVHESLPARAQIWSLGPVVYGLDGEELVVAPGGHAPRSAWAWQWEESYTTEGARWYAEHQRGGDCLTAAAAWGTDEKQVRAAYVKAREKGLKICGQHPEAVRAGQAEP